MIVSTIIDIRLVLTIINWLDTASIAWRNVLCKEFLARKIRDDESGENHRGTIQQIPKKGCIKSVNHGKSN